MAAGYVLYNPLAGTESDRQAVSALEAKLNLPLTYIDITRVTSYPVFFRGLEPEDVVIVAGGDGTLHRFVNDIRGICIPCDIRYFPSGNQNSFAHARGYEKGSEPFSIKQMLSNLPLVTVAGEELRFLHCVGLGPQKKPRHASVTVDGKDRIYHRVWLADARWGRGLAVTLYHNAGRFRARMALPGLLRGESPSPGSTVAVLPGREISVTWDSPCCLCMDGELTAPVSGYTVRTGDKA